MADGNHKIFSQLITNNGQISSDAEDQTANSILSVCLHHTPEFTHLASMNHQRKKSYIVRPTLYPTFRSLYNNAFIPTISY